ncbi:hypothetical protein DSL72_004851 [Monilinia vaccinii-corymbosi]|uniref:Uncharacterized protein n=1 Tax=Monilinia vaccinii-corymbosi TaxID=61207 RepID=A0A8A3P949_9HELO|nr:hypothetical protein DSL72_004851 [Monilinia vaccinii-corymbosi]
MSDSAKEGQFTILYFATASSYTSKDSESFRAPLPLSKLFETLENRYNGMIDEVLRSCLVTINLEYVDIPKTGSNNVEIIIKDGDEVAIVPPLLEKFDELMDRPQDVGNCKPRYEKGTSSMIPAWRAFEFLRPNINIPYRREGDGLQPGV